MQPIMRIVLPIIGLLIAASRQGPAPSGNIFLMQTCSMHRSRLCNWPGPTRHQNTQPMNHVSR